jgi:diaminopimelate decarboxylase
MAGQAEFAQTRDLISPKKLDQVRTVMRLGLIGDETPMAGFVDIDGIRATVRDLQSSFPDHFFHTFAVKANGMRPVLRVIQECGMGAEVASPGEMSQALAAGFSPGDMVFDEPAKTMSAIRRALKLGIHLNIDNFQEFELVKALEKEGLLKSRAGFRVNPQIGAGSIQAMSTATSTSKFGVPLRDDGVRERLIAAYRDQPWLNSLHTHVGSQGCPLELMAAGVKAVADLAEDINRSIGRQQVDTLDIGGGLSVNFAGEQVKPRYADYSSVLQQAAPVLFAGRYRVLTEFGRSVMAKNGFIISRVEYSKTSGGRHIAITHAGAQVAARTVFMPDAWPLRISAHEASGELKTSTPVQQDIAGPCCFAADKVADGRKLPLLERHDIVVIHDAGAYYFSSPFYYNSLPAAPVYGIENLDGAIDIRLMRKAQTIEGMMDLIG